MSVRKPNGGIQQMLRDEPGFASWPIHAQRVAPWAYRYTDFPTPTRDDIMRFVPAVMPRGKGIVIPAPTKLTTFSRSTPSRIHRKVRRTFSNAPLTSRLLFPTSACAARWHGFGVKGLKWK